MVAITCFPQQNVGSFRNSKCYRLCLLVIGSRSTQMKVHIHFIKYEFKKVQLKDNLIEFLLLFYN